MEFNGYQQELEDAGFISAQKGHMMVAVVLRIFMKPHFNNYKWKSLKKTFSGQRSGLNAKLDFVTFRFRALPVIMRSIPLPFIPFSCSDIEVLKQTCDFDL